MRDVDAGLSNPVLLFCIELTNPLGKLQEAPALGLHLLLELF